MSTSDSTAESQYQIGLKTINSSSDPKNVAKALESFEKAVFDQSCHPLALSQCIKLYCNGFGKPENQKKVFQILKNKLSQQESPDLLCDCGLLYEHGIGVEKDLKVAFQYFQKASDLKSARGKCNLGNMYFGLSFFLQVD